MQGSNEQPARLRWGHVAEYDPARHMAKVTFPDLELTSAFLPILERNTLRNNDYAPLYEGEHVSCLMSGNGAEAGVILGAFYDGKNKPPVNDPDKRAVIFTDGTEIIYDSKEHKLTLRCTGDIEITATGGIKLKASRIDLN